jgi:hypothetical protein
VFLATRLQERRITMSSAPRRIYRETVDPDGTEPIPLRPEPGITKADLLRVLTELLESESERNPAMAEDEYTEALRAIISVVATQMNDLTTVIGHNNKGYRKGIEATYADFPALARPAVIWLRRNWDQFWHIAPAHRRALMQTLDSMSSAVAEVEEMRRQKRALAYAKILEDARREQDVLNAKSTATVTQMTNQPLWDRDDAVASRDHGHEMEKASTKYSFAWLVKQSEMVAELGKVLGFMESFPNPDERARKFAGTLRTTLEEATTALADLKVSGRNEEAVAPIIMRGIEDLLKTGAKEEERLRNLLLGMDAEKGDKGPKRDDRHDREDRERRDHPQSERPERHERRRPRPDAVRSDDL